MKKLISDDNDCLVNYGSEMGRKIIRRKKEIEAAETLEHMRNMPGKHHELAGNRKKEISCSLTGNYRLIYTPSDDLSQVTENNELIWSKVRNITIIDINDYH